RSVQPPAHQAAPRCGRERRLGARSRARVCRQAPHPGRCCCPYGRGIMEKAMTEKNWPLWEVFIRSRTGLAHRHVGSVHAVDAAMALANARDVYTRRGEGLSI